MLTRGNTWSLPTFCAKCLALTIGTEKLIIRKATQHIIILNLQLTISNGTDSGTGFETRTSRSQRDHPQLDRTTASCPNYFSKLFKFLIFILLFVVVSLVLQNVIDSWTSKGLIIRCVRIPSVFLSNILFDSLFLKKTYLSGQDNMSATVIMWPLCAAMHRQSLVKTRSNRKHFK